MHSRAHLNLAGSSQERQQAQSTSRVRLFQKLLFNWESTIVKSPIQFFFCDPVGIVLTLYHTRANRLIYKSKPTGWVKKTWTGIQNFVMTFLF